MAAKTIEDYSKAYYAAKAAGDAAGMKAANDAANAIRASQGQTAQYAGEDIANVAAKSSGPAYKTAASGIQNAVQAGRDQAYATVQKKSPTSQADYLNTLYDAQREAALRELQAAYDQNVISLDAAAAKIPGIYGAARNQTASSAEVGKASFNEAAAASGLNTGAGSQVRLSQNNALLGNLSSLNTQEAQAQTDMETERLRIQTGYKNDIASAIAAGDLARAQALYNEAVRVDEGMVSSAYQQAQLALQTQSQQYSQSSNDYSRQLQTAQILAQYGDFSGFSALGISPEQISHMQTYWQSQNAPSGGGGYGGYSAYIGDDGGGVPVSTTSGSGTPRQTTSPGFASTYSQAQNMARYEKASPTQIAFFLRSRIASGVIQEYESDIILNSIGLN